MPSDTVQENWGITNPGGTTSLVIPLTGGNNPSGVGTTAGNTVIAFVCPPGAITGLPSGWGTDRNVGNSLLAYSKSDVPAGETSWTFTLNSASSVDVSFYVVELSGVDPVAPLEVSAATATMGTVADGGTLSTQTTPRNAALDTIAFAVFAGAREVAPTWSGYTNGFEEIQEVTTGTPPFWLAVARKITTGMTDTFGTTATLDTSGSSSTQTGALVVVYRAAGSPIVAPMAMMAGFEWGTHGGINVARNAADNLMSFALGGVTANGTFGTSYLIQAGSARNSNYGLRIVQSASVANVSAGMMAGQAFSFGFDVRVVSATGTVVVANFTSAPYWQLLYDATNSKFGVRAGGAGTVSWQSGTTATNTWVWVDIRIKINLTTWHVEWRLETGADTYTDQAAADLAGQVAGSISNANLILGHTVSQTMTADYDNVCCSTFWAAYPFTPHQIRLLVPDTAATVTYSGTPGNFAIVASNATSTALAGTGGNITTTGVPDRLDEVPPTISASADGVVQTTTAASDYLQFPMSAPTLAADEIVAGVRMLAPLISTTGAGAGDLAIRGYDGTAETALATASQITPGAPTAISATAPIWRCAMWQQAAGWTQTKLAAAALRIGFSGDATPDMGAHALYLEYATRKARVDTVVGEAGGVVADANLNPNTLGTRSITLDTPADQGATLNWSVAGVPDTQPVAASSSHTEVLDAPDADEVDYVEVVSENEDPDRE